MADELNKPNPPVDTAALIAEVEALRKSKAELLDDYKKAKEAAKKFSKAKSAIKMIRKSIEMSTTVTQETIDKAESMIAEIEGMIERGEAPSEGKVKKLSELV